MCTTKEIINPATMPTTDEDVLTLHEEYEKTVKSLAVYALKVTDNESMKDVVLFRVAPKESMVDTYLDAFNQLTRQQYNCNCCKHFLRRYGTAVYIDRTGELHSIVWDPESAVGRFKPIVAALKDAVERGTVIDIVRALPTDSVRYDGINMMTLGIAESCEGKFHHFHADISTKYVKMVSPTISMDTIKDEFTSAERTFKRWNSDTIDRAYALAKLGKLAKEDAKERFNLFKQMYEDVTNTKHALHKYHKICNYAIKYHDFLYGFIGTVDGTLLDDISEGYDINICISRYNAKMDPINYKRPTAAPTERLVEEAEKLIADLGLKDSLDRRIARFDEIKRFLWKAPEKVKEKAAGIFANVKTKDSKPKQESKIDLSRNSTNITLSKFMREVAPRTTKMSIELKVGYRYPFCTFVTEAHEGSKPIIKWDYPEARNPISMYCYHEGSSCRDFNVTTGYVEVLGIATFPDDLNSAEDTLNGVAFILKDCKDMLLGGGSALFPDVLIKELYPVRKVIESFSKDKKLEDIPDGVQAAAGLAVGGPSINYRVRVETTDNTIEAYRIDRLD